MSDLISRQYVFDALIEKAHKSKRFQIGDFWELNFSEIKRSNREHPRHRARAEEGEVDGIR